MDDDNEQKQRAEILRQALALVRGVHGADADDDEMAVSESEVTTNALVGPARVYGGVKTAQNDFIIDSGKAKLADYKDDTLRALVQRARDERALREAEAQRAEEASAAAGRPPPEDKLGLGEIRIRLSDSSSPLAQLFLETRWSNMANFLVRFAKRKASILASRALRLQSPPLRQPQTQKQQDAQDVFEFEKATEDIVLGRIAILTDVILREFEAVDYIRHQHLGLPLEFVTRTGLPPPPPSPVQRTRGGGGDDDDGSGEGSGSSTPTSAAGGTKRRRQGGASSSTSTVVSRRQAAMVSARMAVIVQMLSAIDSVMLLTGMVSLKRELARFIVSSIIRVNAANAVQQFQAHINILLYGQPGTGKSTVASRIGDIFRALGLIPEPMTVGYKMASYDRSTLVAGFEGQTAIKTRQAFANNYGGVIFVDEIYTLRQGERDEAGNEAVDTIVKLTEDYKGEVLLIGAGYEDLIRRRILLSNAGFSSRFPYKWRLPNYSAQQLLNIIQRPVVPGNFGSRFDLFGPRVDAVHPTFVGDTKKILTELVGRAWEKNLFEDTNARGAINLKRAIDDVLTQRLFLESENKDIERTAQPIARDVYVAFTIWARAEKDVEVYYTSEVVRNLIKD